MAFMWPLAALVLLLFGAPGPAAAVSPSPSPLPVPFSTTADWKYLDTGVDLGTSWVNTTFNDAAWLSGPAPLGFGFTGVQNTAISSAAQATTFYFRRNLTATSTLVSATKLWTLTVMVNDGAVVYINGKELRRENMPTGTIGYRTLAATGLSSVLLSTTLRNFSTCTAAAVN